MSVQRMTFFFVNSYVIKAGDKTILFDCGAILEPEKLADFVAEQGVDPKEIDLIIVSHDHFDHMQLLGAWKELTGAKVLCHKNAAQFLETGEKPNLFTFGKRAQELQPFMDFMIESFKLPTPRITPDILVGDEDYDLHEMGIPGKIIYTPGHTDSHISLVLDDRTIFSGDTFLDWHTVQPIADMFPPRTVGYNWVMEDIELAQQSVARMLEVADTFYGGHGETYTREEVENLLLS